jgi:hypothetical protein
MSEATDKTIALNVRLKPSESSARDEPHERRPGPGNCRCRFRFHRDSVACRYRKDRERWQAAPKGLDGTLVIRVATGWTCWRGCISRFSKSWSGWVTLGSRSRTLKPERGAGWQACDCETRH